MQWIEELSNIDNRKNQVFSMSEYLDLVASGPRQHIRPTNLYFKDMLDSFGRTEHGHFKLFQKEYPDSPAIHGQLRAQKRIYQNLRNFCEEGFNNKLILLVGPNGSSKSSLIKKLMIGAEEYSSDDDGALYTFSWIFPIETYVKGHLGLSTERHSRSLESYAHLEDNEISAILSSELKDHPLLLFPSELRQKYIQELIGEDREHYDIVKKSYLFNGDLSKRNRMIYDALLKNYKGNHQEVLKHIRVERFIISKRHSSSAISIEPQLHVDAKIQQITMDKRLSALPPSLQTLDLFTMRGEAVLANRGVLEFSDLLKRPLDTFKYLLMTMETKNINLQGVLTELDIFFIGSSNEIHLHAFKQHPDFNSFKGRINFVTVPYLLNAEDEIKIYEEQIENLHDHCHFEPHALMSLGLFCIMTRIRAGQDKNYSEKKLGRIVSQLTPLEKALFLTYGQIPEHLDSEKSQILSSSKDLVEKEFVKETLYEGKFGISPREVKQIIYELSSNFDHVSFIDIIEYLEDFIKRKNDYEFLNIAPQGKYHNPGHFIMSLKDHFTNIFDTELRESLGMVDNRSYEDYISKYIKNVSCLIKGEKIRNTITAKYEDPDEYFIKEFESNIGLKEDANSFRSHTISTLGAYSLDNPSNKLEYSKVFPHLIERLKESFRDEQKKIIERIGKDLVFYEAEIHGDEEVRDRMSKENRQLIKNVLTNLKDKYNYSEIGALSLTKFLIKEKY